MNKVWITIIVVLVTINAYLFVSWRNTAAENETLQTALKNPKTVQLPIEKVVQKPPQVITRTIVVEKNQSGEEKTTIQEEVKDQGNTIETTKDQGHTSEAVIPQIPAGPLTERCLMLFGSYDTESRWQIGAGYQVFKNLPITMGLGYRNEPTPTGMVWVALRL